MHTVRSTCLIITLCRGKEGSNERYLILWEFVIGCPEFHVLFFGRTQILLASAAHDILLESKFWKEKVRNCLLYFSSDKVSSNHCPGGPLSTRLVSTFSPAFANCTFLLFSRIKKPPPPFISEGGGGAQRQDKHARGAAQIEFPVNGGKGGGGGCQNIAWWRGWHLPFLPRREKKEGKSE